MGQMDKTPLFGLGISIACMVVSAIVVKQYFSKMPTGCAFVTQPGLVGLLLGALPEMWKYILRYEAHSGLAEYHEQEGDTLYFDFGLLRYFMPAVVITRDPRNVKYMLKTKFDSFVKGVTFHTIGLDLLGDGIFNVDGDLWFKQRKTASQMFTANRFKQHIWKVVRKNCDKVISLLRASQEPTVDIFNVLNRFTLDSIGEIGFGTDIGSLENPESPFLGSFDAAQRLMFIRFVLPCWRLLRFLGLGPERHSRHHMQKLREYSRQIVVRLSSSLDTPAGDSFVGLFMKSGSNYSVEFLVDLVLNFIIAGRDTTAQAMSWCLFLIMQHPEVEERILQEVQSVFGDQPITYDQLFQLTYTEAVLRESLRLYPSVPMDPKCPSEPETLPDGTFVPRGTSLFYNSYAMGRSTNIWGADALEFRPDRWLNAEPKDPYEYPVFHAGPRECLGKRLAMVEMKTVVASLIKHVKLRLAVPVDAVLPDTAATLGMSSGLRCYVEMR